MTKKVNLQLKKAFQLFIKDRIAESLSIIDTLQQCNLSAKDQAKLKKVLEIFLLGELLGLHTMTSILSTLHISSNNLQKLWQGFTYQQIGLLCSELMVSDFTKQLVQLSKKSESTWSRANVCIVIDDSIFKQWLKNMPIGGLFAKYFSGQTHSTVYGFRITLLGVSLGNEFYPLYFHLSHKKEKTKEVAFNLLKKVRRLLKQIADNESIGYPNLFLSVDSGFTYERLMKYCERTNITFIGVPKKNNKFQIGSFKGNLTNYIKKVFLSQEQQHLIAQKDKQCTPFLMRVKANFQTIDREVTLLFFRLNGSKKVTVIFSTSPTVMAKTLRRRFFQRTKIEQFFRFLKDTLKIQTSKNVDAITFLKKLNLFIIKAMTCRQFEKEVQKQFQLFRHWAFTKLRHHLVYEKIGLEDLESLVKMGAFAT